MLFILLYYILYSTLNYFTKDTTNVAADAQTTGMVFRHVVSFIHSTSLTPPGSFYNFFILAFQFL
jgi:hypothetical protein